MVLLARLDPIVNPGQPSSHVHSVFGVNTFNRQMTLQDLRIGQTFAQSITTCNIPVDHSSYWAPSMYWIDPNGIHHLVNTEFKAYYFPNNAAIGLPPGLRMFVGDPMRQTDTRINGDPYWVCVDYADTPNNSKFFRGFPNVFCRNWQFRITFPDCWDGNTDFENFRERTTFKVNGKCPAGFQEIPTVFFEVDYKVGEFESRGAKVTDFVLSSCYKTGFSGHADFISGWESNVVLEATKTCNGGQGAWNGACSLSRFRNSGAGNVRPVANLNFEPIDKVQALPGKCSPMKTQ